MNSLPEKNNDILKKLLKNDLLEQPSDKFNSAVFEKLGILPAGEAIKYEPVISKKGWMIIVAISTVILWIAFFGSPSDAVSSNTVLIDTALNQTASLFDSLMNNSYILIITILSIAVFFLVGAESIYRQSRLKAA